MSYPNDAERVRAETLAVGDFLNRNGRFRRVTSVTEGRLRMYLTLEGDQLYAVARHTPVMRRRK